jgi:hypothetical protein
VRRLDRDGSARGASSDGGDTGDGGDTLDSTTSGPSYRRLPGVPMGSFAATDRVIHVMSPPKSGRAER